MGYALQRLALFPIILIGVSVLVFVAIRLIPGDAITALLGTEGGLLTPAQRLALEIYFGIDQPWPAQYLRWIAGVVQGDLGISAVHGRPVLQIILERFPLTLELAVLSLIIALVIGIPAGMYAAANRQRTSDMAVRIFAMLGQSTPNFVLGLVLIFTLSVVFGALPVMGEFVSFRADPLANLAQMALPAITLGFSFAASVMRTTRASMLDVLSEDYVRTALAKGTARGSVFLSHALPNALIPILTLTGLEFGYLLGGAVIVEELFALPGLGRLVLDAISQRDYALVQGGVLFIALNFMLINLLVDLGYAVLDPRVRLASGR